MDRAGARPQRGAFPDEAAHALQARRAELRAAVDRRKDARFLSAGVRDEVVDEAIAVVVMSRKPIQNEEHLQGAFWTSVGYLVAERRAGRHELRIGSQRRVAFEPLAGELAVGDDRLTSWKLAIVSCAPRI